MYMGVLFVGGRGELVFAARRIREKSIRPLCAMLFARAFN